MCICGGCGKLIDSQFYYCPWCGYSRIDLEKEESENLRLIQFKRRQLERRNNLLNKMEKQLDDLEKELSVLVLSSEMHR